MTRALFSAVVFVFAASFALAQDNVPETPTVTPPQAPAAGTIEQTRAPASEPSAGGSGLYIKVGEAKLRKSLMALPPFQFSGSPGGSSARAIRAGQELFNVFRNDMDVSGYFDFIKPQAFLEDASKVGLKPAPGEAGGFHYDSWKQIGTEFLVRVGYHMNGSDLTVDTYVYFVPQAKLVLGKTYHAKVDDIRTVAHTFANDVIKEMTGQRGMFLSRAVVSRTTAGVEKEIFLMDWDGGNVRQITHHHGISSSPALSFDGRMIAYSTYSYHTAEKTRNRDLWTYDLTNGKRYLVSYRRGINSGATFFPDNSHVAFTLSQGGVADIYRATTDGKGLAPITHGNPQEISVEPAISPDGKRIAYSSDKSGYAMIYVMNIDGTSMKRITFAGKFNSTPAWSPDGKRLAFAGMDKDHYDIFLMDADGMNMSRLTTARKANGKGANNEYPSFSPDGRYVMFASDRTGKYQLYIVTIDGETERRITFDSHDYQQPHWSAFFE